MSSQAVSVVMAAHVLGGLQEQRAAGHVGSVDNDDDDDDDDRLLQ